MGRKKKGGNKGGSQRPIKGFRPGKAPPQLKRQQARAELGSDAGWAQRAMVDTVADRTPAEVRALVGRWALLLLVGAVALGILGVFLYGWSTLAGIAVHVLGLVLLVLWYRVRRQGERLVTMAETLGDGGRR